MGLLVDRFSRSARGLGESPSFYDTTGGAGMVDGAGLAIQLG